MKRLVCIVLAGGAALLGNAAFAQQANPRLPAITIGKTVNASDCALAKDPLRCEAQLKAQQTCKGKRGADRRRCLAEQPSPIDCRRADNPRHCEALQAAREACRNKSGAQHRQCMRELTTP
jgi:hypothetical protein